MRAMRNIRVPRLWRIKAQLIGLLNDTIISASISRAHDPRRLVECFGNGAVDPLHVAATSEVVKLNLESLIGRRKVYDLPLRGKVG
jgi:hypothetical protein